MPQHEPRGGRSRRWWDQRKPLSAMALGGLTTATALVAFLLPPCRNETASRQTPSRTPFTVKKPVRGWPRPGGST